MKLSRIGGMGLVLFLPFLFSGVASASPDTTLTLTVQTGKELKSVELFCSPFGGSHPDAEHACKELGEARGNLDALPGLSGTTTCTMEYSPVTAKAEGTWDGEAVAWTHEFGNSCNLYTATGTVFSF
ncbi:SSI family serine proteinase inhibitor [Actinophytocola oryzae]|uniref:Subtilisin inhibitor-like n=1 Tax=Actinophytocola oryzae TaxID=502181 RepID=A0A4R7UVI6_9PSEU|nr:SSI family serine proteinase inhibitor [Actinophytocola oryzae]TDV40763.1 subtilisin inhibitor-like [Actinophytocola oryzae]